MPKELIEEARRNPNGYVYVIDKRFSNNEEVPPEFIKGAWKVDENGQVIGKFIENPNYHKSKRGRFTTPLQRYGVKKGDEIGLNVTTFERLLLVSSRPR